MACSCGRPKTGWRITYPNGTTITTTSAATKAMAEAAGAKTEKLDGA